MWIEVPPSALQGHGLSPYREGEIRNLFDWAERTDAASAHLMAHRGRFIVDVVAIEHNAVHQPSKPGDEVVVVLNGVLTLTDDGEQFEQVIQRGEMVLIPAGWAGIYRVESAHGLFRELAIVPADYFDDGVAPGPSGKSPRRLELSGGPGHHTLHTGRYSVELRQYEQAASWSMTGAEEVIILVLAGTLSLHSDARSGTFAAGAVVVVPRDAAVRMRAESGYRGLHLRWLE
jgi:quercetin dioxygenase-like cupin family protein